MVEIRGAEVMTYETDDPADIADCLAIRKAVFVGEQKVPIELERDGLDPICRHFIARAAERALGASRLKPAEDAVKIQRLAVLSEARGHGVGRRLMERMLETAKRDYPARAVVLSAQVDAIRFYEALGFVGEGEEYLDAGIRHLDMRLVRPQV